MKHYKFSITFKSEILLGQSKTPTASRRSRSLVFAVWCMAPSCMNMAGPATGGCQGVPQPWTSSKFHQAVMIALDLDQWKFAITGKIPQHRDGSVGVDMSSLDTGRMEMFKGTFWRPQGSPYKAYLARIPRTVLPGISKIWLLAAAFMPATEVPTIRHRWASVVLIVVIWRKYCHSNATDGRNLWATVAKLLARLPWNMAEME